MCLDVCVLKIQATFYKCLQNADMKCMFLNIEPLINISVSFTFI